MCLVWPDIHATREGEEGGLLPGALSEAHHARLGGGTPDRPLAGPAGHAAVVAAWCVGANTMKKIAAYKGWALVCASNKKRFVCHKNGCPFVYSNRVEAGRSLHRHVGIVRVSVLVDIEKAS